MDKPTHDTNPDRPRPRIGVLPLYLALYDEVVPKCRPGRQAFAHELGQWLTSRGLDVVLAEICCVREEVERELASLAPRDLDLLTTVHLAYSPSLESAEPLASSPAPLALLDTTEAARFDQAATRDEMFANHGIHGVQDLASVLRRMGRSYFVIAGHVADEAFLDEVVATAQAARAGKALRNCTTALVGKPFAGMGDFALEFDALRESLGPKVQNVELKQLAARIAEVSNADLDAEAREDAARFDIADVPADVLRESNRVGLALRAILDETGANAFSMNFQTFDLDAGTPTVPFLEASKAMARGIGYAGEGDVLTASFVGALMAGFGEATFTEMFCPDWEGNSIFMSHMGECNIALAASRPKLVEKDYSFGNVRNPAVALFPLRPGPATLANIAPGPRGGFSVIAARVEVLERGLSSSFRDVPHFWIRPRNADVRDFLRLYSEAGGTHHLALLPGDHTDGLRRVAQILRLQLTEV